MVEDKNLRKSEENNKQNISVKRRSVDRNTDQKEKDIDSIIRTRYGRII